MKKSVVLAIVIAVGSSSSVARGSQLFHEAAINFSTGLAIGLVHGGVNKGLEIALEDDDISHVDSFSEQTAKTFLYLTTLVGAVEARKQFPLSTHILWGQALGQMFSEGFFRNKDTGKTYWRPSINFMALAAVWLFLETHKQ